MLEPDVGIILQNDIQIVIAINIADDRDIRLLVMDEPILPASVDMLQQDTLPGVGPVARAGVDDIEQAVIVPIDRVQGWVEPVELRFIQADDLVLPGVADAGVDHPALLKHVGGQVGEAVVVEIAGFQRFEQPFSLKFPDERPAAIVAIPADVSAGAGDVRIAVAVEILDHGALLSHCGGTDRVLDPRPGHSWVLPPANGVCGGADDHIDVPVSVDIACIQRRAVA